MNEQHIVFKGKAYGIVYHLLVFGKGLAKTHVDDFCAIFDRVADGIGNVFIPFISIGYRSEGHNAHVVGHALDADVIIADSTDNTGYVRSMVSIRARYIRIAIVSLATVLVVIAYGIARIKFFV